MDNKFKLLIIIILFIIILFNYYNNNNNNNNTINNIFSHFKETFTQKNQIILMGDSMFANEDYVFRNQSVLHHLSKHHYNSLSIAKDGAVISDLYIQLLQIPHQYKKKQNLLFISIGGNNILNEYNKNTANKSDMKKLSKIFKDYKNAVLKIQKKSNMTIILLNLYYPSTMPDFHPLIDYWNKSVNMFANERDIKVLEVSKLLRKPNHFKQGIEPSNKGGKILSAALYESAYTT